MQGSKVIIEGDSFPTIQWGSSSSIHPWRLADCVEKIRFISSLLNVSTSHVRRTANSLADVLARNGASCTNLVFDV